jgi:hypothetical protein
VLLAPSLGWWLTKRVAKTGTMAFNSPFAGYNVIVGRSIGIVLWLVVLLTVFGLKGNFGAELS